MSALPILQNSYFWTHAPYHTTLLPAVEPVVEPHPLLPAVEHIPYNINEVCAFFNFDTNTTS